MPKFIGGHSLESVKYFLSKIQACRRTEDHTLWSLDTSTIKGVFEARLAVPVSKCFNLVEICRITTRHQTDTPTIEGIISGIHPNDIQRVEFFEIIRFEKVGEEWLAIVILYRSSGRLYAPG